MSAIERIDWKHLDEQGFDRIVEALLVAHHGAQPGVRAYALDGRGGDDGIDVAVERDGAVEHIYQLKFFPEGFSSGWAHSRRPQIKKSFNRAVDKHPSVKQWTLVVPGNGTKEERKHVFAMRGSRQVRIGFLGQAELDGLMAEHPLVHAWATRAPLVDVLRQIKQEQAALVGPNDLSERARALGTLANERSPYWGTTITVSSGETTETLYAKRPDAAEREPLQVSFTSTFGPGRSALREEFTAAMDWGVTTPVRLPSDVVQRVERIGPEWFADETETAEVELHPVPVDPQPAELRVLAGTGAVQASLSGSATAISGGRLGGTLTTRFRDCLQFEWRMPRESTSGSVQVSFESAGVPASDATAVLRLLDAMTEDATTELWVKGARLFATSIDLSGLVDDDGLRSWFDDVAFLERTLGLAIELPEQVTAIERVRVRAVRLMLEGQCVLWPGVRDFSGTSTGELDDSVELALTKMHMVAMTMTEFPLTIGDATYSVGEVQIFHPRMEVEGGAEILASLRGGEGEGLRMRHVPMDGTAFRAYSPPRWRERWRDPNRPLVPDPWNVPGVNEDASLAAIRDAAGVPPPAEGLDIAIAPVS